VSIENTWGETRESTKTVKAPMAEKFCVCDVCELAITTKRKRDKITRFIYK